MLKLKIIVLFSLVAGASSSVQAAAGTLSASRYALSGEARRAVIAHQAFMRAHRAKLDEGAALAGLRASQAAIAEPFNLSVAMESAKIATLYARQLGHNPRLALAVLAQAKASADAAREYYQQQHPTEWAQAQARRAARRGGLAAATPVAARFGGPAAAAAAPAVKLGGGAAAAVSAPSRVHHARSEHSTGLLAALKQSFQKAFPRGKVTPEGAL